jgi:hypothetical protein
MTRGRITLATAAAAARTHRAPAGSSRRPTAPGPSDSYPRPPWSGVISALLASALVFHGSSCASIAHGRWQDISISSEPPGARVVVARATDAVPHATGTTPMTVRLKRRLTGYTVRIEADGHDPVEIPLRRGTSRWVAGDAVGLGLMVANLPFCPDADCRAGTLITNSILFGGVDLATGAIHQLEPSRVEVRLGAESAVPARSSLALDELVRARVARNLAAELSRGGPQLVESRVRQQMEHDRSRAEDDGKPRGDQGIADEH